MVKGLKLQILLLDEVDSTQLYLKKALIQKKLTPPCGVLAKIQTAGVGSRENSWIGLEGNFFFSFALNLNDLPQDLKLESASIYFAYLLREVLEELGSKVWLKWPNDFYVEDKKIGGMITNIVGNSLVCGVGINLVKNPNSFAKLDIVLSKEKLLGAYVEKIEKRVLWKQVFSKYKLEFQKSKTYTTHAKEHTIALCDAILNDDGSITSNGERVYSLR